MELQGQVADIIYQNDTNSYLIATFETQDELLTIVRLFAFCEKWR